MDMVTSSDRSLQMLATALEKEKKGREFYKDAAERCANELGKEMFRTLMAEEGIHIMRIREIYQALEGSKAWSDQWKAHKIRSGDLEKLIIQRVRILGPRVKAETGDMEAVKIGIEMEQGAISFYDEQLLKATDPLEREFIQCMVAEERGHFAALEDVKLYFENPQSWFVEKEHHVLDGA
jgi:rubrerythrin